ncbi:MAG: hypothetical protein WC376_05370 [Candidatus Nanoarchaeia archaeon]|jgi:hypothetical protein
MLSNNFIKTSIILIFLPLFLKSSMGLILNDSFYLNENETYYEFSKDLVENNAVTINLSNIVIDGKNHYFTGQFNVNSQNVTFINIRFSSCNNFISAYNSGIKILNSEFKDSANAINLFNSNFSLINNSFFNINNLLNINSDSFSANISQNLISNVATSMNIISSSSIADAKINLNMNQSDFYELFKTLGADINHYFNFKQFFSHNCIIYEVANNYDSFSNLLKAKSRNIALGANITAAKTLSLTNDVNIYGNNNYFISSINRDYSIVIVGDIDFKIDSLNLVSDSNIALSNMGANATITNCSIFSENIGYYQLEGELNISNSDFYFPINSSKTIGMHIESGKASLSNVEFFNAESGIITLNDSTINGIIPQCSNHSSYKIILTNLESAFSKNSIIIPEKSLIYGKEYDYYKGITVQNLGQNISCSYPGFLLGEKYPWETEYEILLTEIRTLIGLKSQNPIAALGDLNFIESYNNYSILYSSKTPEYLANDGKVHNPFLSQKIAVLDINISKDDLWISYPTNIIILPINLINSSRVISKGEFESNELIILNDFEVDFNNSITKGELTDSIKIYAPENITHLVLKKEGQTIFNSTLNDYEELVFNLTNSSGIIPELSGQYDFYWVLDNEVQYIERLNVKIINNVILNSNNTLQSYYNNIKKILFEYYSDYEKGIIDFSNNLKNNTLSLNAQLMIERNLGNKVLVTIPTSIYSTNDWNGLFLMPTLVKDYVFRNETAAFAFKVGHESIDLYTDLEFSITISGFSGFDVGFENQTGVYELPKTDYFDNGNDLVVKTKHLSTFFIYQKKQVSNQAETAIETTNNSLIQELSPANETEAPKLQQITGFIEISSMNQADSLNCLRVMFSILIIFATLFVIKKNFFD